VRIIAAEPSPSGSIATTITAAYVNGRRRNLTPCPGGIGSDAARYRGGPLAAPEPTPESTPSGRTSR
jgi:hypothetical protein